MFRLSLAITAEVFAVPGAVLSARLGGEEFGLPFVGLSLDEVYRELETFRKKLASTPLVSDGLKIQVTSSIGVTKYGDNLNEMLSFADTGLYEAKEAGRNNVVIS